ncbi:hypothetical protein JHV675_31540 [Mycobacterium avium subsp. hominissuis]
MGRAGKRRIEKVSETLAREILHDILDRGLTAGARLPPESELVASYGVGKSSVREALRLLEVNGVVTIKTGPTGGPIVAESSPVEFAKMSVFYFRSTRVTFGELIEARIMMESMMAGLAASRRNPQTEQALRESLVLTKAAVDSGDYQKYLDEASNFHGIISGLSGNRVLDFFGGALSQLYYERVAETLMSADSGRLDFLDEHEAITNAVLAGDADAARGLMEAHMNAIQQRLDDYFPTIGSEIIDWR